jgi:hypothetical protein
VAETSVPRLIVAPSAHEWGSREDRRWQSDLFELRQRLDRSAPGAVAPLDPAEGHMGIELAQVIVDLASAGVFAAAFETIKTWIQERPGRREIEAEFEFEDNGTVRRGHATITAHNLTSNDVSTALGRVLEERG